MKPLAYRCAYLTLIVILAVIVSNVRTKLADIREVMDVNIAGDARLLEAGKMQVEFQDFLLKAQQFAANDENVSKGDVTLSFDILWSRVNTLGFAADYYVVQHIANSREFFAALQTALAKADPHVAALQRGGAAELSVIDRELAGLRAPVSAFTQAAAEQKLAKTIAAAEKQRIATVQIREMQMLFLGFGFLMVFMLAAEVMRVQRLNRSIKGREAEIIEIGLADSLTGLRNRRFLVQHLDAALSGQRAGDLTLLLLDLDGFKAVNDTYGHLIGDELLKTVATRLAAITPQGAIAARLGGDEFALAVTDGRTSAVQLAAKIIEELEKSFSIGGREIFISASVGLADGAENAAANSNSILGDADIALYEAKGAGRGCLRYYDIEQRKKQTFRHDIEESLGQAIDNGEVSVHFHPQFDLAARQVIGVEALARWQHPVYGDISPEVFVKAAEKTGLIRKLDFFVLETACREVRVLARAGFDLRLSLNVSPIEAGRRGYAHELLQALERLKFPRRRLTLELTENAVMEDFKTVERNLNVLVEAGIEFAIDDFGAGYSNLSYLARFPFNYLKVDRRLAENITSSAKDRIVLNGIVTLARGLELRVIMEGIETAEQLAFAERIGVPEAQGYLFAEPLSGERLIPFLSAHSAKNKPAKRRKAAA